MHGCNDSAKFPAAFASCVRRLAACLGLTLLCIATAWAGRGDIDPNYGEGGRLAYAAPGPSTGGALLALPGDRLVIADGNTESFRVWMVDAAGRNVTGFGDGGVVLIDSPEAARTFWPEAAAAAPNGDMIFAGMRLGGAQGLLRLDNDGQPVLSFGNRGDGIVEPAIMTGGAIAFTLDPGGKIVLAEQSRNPDDGSCGSPARLQRLLPDGQPDTGFGDGTVISIPDLDICNGAAVFGARADSSVIVGDGHAIVAIDAAGDIDPTFGVDGRLIFTELGEARGLMLPDDSLLIIGSSDEAAANDTVFLKFDRNGQPDLDFGHGAGSVTVDLGGELLGEPFAREDVEQLVLDPDGEHMVAKLRVSHADGSFACSGIARLSMDGVPDTSFGRNGLTCLNLNFALLAVQSDGAPLFSAGNNSDSILRLLTDNSPSPGLLTGGVATSLEVGESEGTATVIIERVAGHDGAVSAGFTAVGRRLRYACGTFDADGDWIEFWCWSVFAIAGRDYTATSGRLDWASGDDSQRTVTVSIHDDDIDEGYETFGVDLSEPSGGVLLFAENPTFAILNNDTATSPPPPKLTGGGGSVSWVTPLALLALLLVRRRQDRRVVAQIGTAAASAFLATILATLLAACGGGSSLPPSTPPPPVSIVAGAASIAPATMLPISASVRNDPAQQGVSWTLSPATGAGTLSDATSTSVTYNAPDNPPASDLTVTIMATSIADNANSATATITIPANVVFVAETIPCPDAAAALNASCGTVDVPLDRRNVVSGTIPIYFERYTHTGAVLESAIVFRNGGPGRSTPRAKALRIFGPNLDAHDLLLIDARGTGRSNAIDCPSLQRGMGSWEITAAECAAQLGPAASFYGSVDIAKDTEAVRMALGYDKIDYYGLSWGGVTVTAYATRFASHLRSIILDAPLAGPLLDESKFVWERYMTQSAPLTIAQQCLHSPACSADHPDPAAEIVALIQSIRANPVEGAFVDAGGNSMYLRIDESDLLTCMIASGSAFFRSSGELPAAAQALAQGDQLPLLRLRAEGFCPGPYDHGDPMQVSAGAGWATGCIDLDQPFDWSKPVPDRLTAYSAAADALPSGYFEPFASSAATSFQFSWGACIYFERPTPTQPVVRPEANYSSTPTLVLGGDIDFGFPTAAVEAVAGLYPGSTWIKVADAGHTTADWSQCARNLISEFVSNLRIDNPACAQVPETVWPAVGRFPLLATGARPADVDAGGVNEIDVEERKVVTTAVAAVTDAMKRALGGGPGNGLGLRGGSFSAAWGPTLTLSLVDCAFAIDVRVSGTVVWEMSTLLNGGFLPGHRPLTADLVVSGPGTAGGTLHVAGNWLSNDAIGQFSVTGMLGGKTVAVLVPEA